jgi:hypothetical protein
MTVHRQLGVQVGRLPGLSHHPYQRDMTLGDLPQWSHGAAALAGHPTPYLTVLYACCTDKRDAHVREPRATKHDARWERMSRQYLAWKRCATRASPYHLTLPLPSPYVVPQS